MPGVFLCCDPPCPISTSGLGPLAPSGAQITAGTSSPPTLTLKLRRVTPSSVRVSVKVMGWLQMARSMAHPYPLAFPQQPAHPGESRDPGRKRLKGNHGKHEKHELGRDNSRSAQLASVLSVFSVVPIL